MGDRATVQVINNEYFSPLAYTHWHGSNILKTIKKAAPKMRKGDISYAFARLSGHLHNATGGDEQGLSFGIWNVDQIVTEDEVGDAGHFQINLANGEVRNWSGGCDGDIMATVELGAF